MFNTAAKPLSVKILYAVHQTSISKGNTVIRQEQEINIPAFIDNKRNPARQQLYEMLLNAADIPPVILDFILPKFIRVTNRGSLILVDSMMSAESGIIFFFVIQGWRLRQDSM